MSSLTAESVVTEMARPEGGKALLLVMDGLGGYRTAERGSELTEARTPNLDRLASEGSLGLHDPVPVEEIQEGIKHGVRKINIDTDNRMAMTGQIRKVLTENPSEFDPRKYLKPAMEAMTKLCKQRFEEFNTAGKGSKIRPISVAEMAKRYSTGELDPTFATTRAAAE